MQTYPPEACDQTSTHLRYCDDTSQFLRNSTGFPGGAEQVMGVAGR
jgi:hypothetical protein